MPFAEMRRIRYGADGRWKTPPSIVRPSHGRIGQRGWKSPSARFRDLSDRQYNTQYRDKMFATEKRMRS